jgi:hypothetical protein
MQTDWNAETFYMAENSLSDVTLIHYFTILLSQWRVPPLRKIIYCMLTKRIIGLLFPISIIRVIKSRRIRLARHVARMGKRIGVYRVLVGKPEGKRSLGRPRHRWENNIKMGLYEVGCGGMDWFALSQDREGWRTLVNAVMNLRVP